MGEYILEMNNITKVFPGVKALDNVSLKVRPGSVHALMGENLSLIHICLDLQHIDIFISCFLHLLAAHRMEHAALSLKGNDDILSYGQIRKDSVFLPILRQICHAKLHGIDWRTDLNFFASDFQLAAVRLVCAIDRCV